MGPLRLALGVALINPHAPRPYTFTEAALCLQASIRAAGCSSELHVNRSDSAGRAIVLGALPPHLPAVEQLDPRRTAIFNFEQLGAASSIAGDSYAPWLRRWMVIDYHSENIAWLRARHPGQRALELPLVPGPAIAFRPELAHAPVNDVLFYGTLSPRREEILRRLREAGLAVEVVAGAFGEELTPAIRRARVVLHVHYYERGLFPVARILQPVAQGVPLVCEDSLHSQLNDWSRSGIVFAPYEQLADACAALASDAREREQRAAANRAFAAALDFATPFERLLREMDWLPPPGIEPPQLLAAPPAPLDEIEAEAAREATELPEAHETPPPVKLVERVPGQGRYGLWVVVLLVLFSVFTIWQGLQSLMRVP